jgi:sugar (pentulose or hexulose) kinase
MQAQPSPIYLGIDFGTSGVRGIGIDQTKQVVATVSLPYPDHLPSQAESWQSALFSLLQTLPVKVRSRLTRIAINGTSSTVVLCDRQGQPLANPLMYDFACDASFVQDLTPIAPAGHPVLAVTSSLCKALHWQRHRGLFPGDRLLHQADWLAAQLHGRYDVSDYHNCLKLGFDPALATYPDWFNHPTLAPLLAHFPQVVPPGEIVGGVQGAIAQQYQIPPTCQVCAGTTDSIAAFIASGANQLGEGVTSLGSTLVLKLLSPLRIDRAEYGLYSHWYGHHWLVGGASNTGGAVLAQWFTPQELAELSQQIDPSQPSPLDYYPLLKPGERFPIQDPNLAPCLEPQPGGGQGPVGDHRTAFLHGILESMARIEAQGYRLLTQFGAGELHRVYTAGGGAQNPAWTAIRARVLGVPVVTAHHSQAAYGAALLAKQQGVG